jgi:hypothetical protein
MSTSIASTIRRTVYLPEDLDLKLRVGAALKKQSVNELINQLLQDAFANLDTDAMRQYIGAHESN